MPARRGAGAGAAPAELKQLRNLGPKSAAMLSAAGIDSVDALRALRAARAYVRVRRSTRGASLNLLWALEGALSDRPWQAVARDDRLALLLQVETLDADPGTR